MFVKFETRNRAGRLIRFNDREMTVLRRLRTFLWSGEGVCDPNVLAFVNLCYELLS
jgi:hypothetical protein